MGQDAQNQGHKDNAREADADAFSNGPRFRIIFHFLKGWHFESHRNKDSHYAIGRISSPLNQNLRKASCVSHPVKAHEPAT
jgi:Ser/Thr protein kinase RdoA (MazF antagonist)